MTNNSKNVIARFAPSPTGNLHVGNVRTALLNWLFCKKLGGQFLLRLDDTDLERSREEFAESIQTDLSWLSLDWDGFYRQSERLSYYEEKKQDLIASGCIYPCYESSEEIDLKRKILLSQGKPPIYDREGLNLKAEQIEEFEKQGRRPHYRFKLSHQDVIWNDLIRGECHYNTSHISDPVIIREDGTPLYTFTSVVDDIEHKVTHVLRGEDHVTNTVVQIEIFKALNGILPAFGHFPLITDKDGKGLSKRLGSLGIGDLREQGLDAFAINLTLANLGTSGDILKAQNMQDCIEIFNIESYARSTPKFAEDELWRIHRKLMCKKDFTDIKAQLSLNSEISIAVQEQLWLVVRENIEDLQEFHEWEKICFQIPNFYSSLTEDEIAFIKETVSVLPNGEWNEETWSQWIANIKSISDRKGKFLFMPLRKALTGKESGPELKYLLPIIGKERVQNRLVGGS